MRSIFKLLVVLVLLGGWPLAASSLQVVRYPGDLPVLGDVGRLSIYPKDRLTFSKTYVDTRGWSLESVAENRSVVKHMMETGRLEMLSHLGEPATIEAAMLGLPPVPHEGGGCCPPEKHDQPAPTTQPQVSAKPTIFEQFDNFLR